MVSRQYACRHKACRLGRRWYKKQVHALRGHIGLKLKPRAALLLPHPLVYLQVSLVVCASHCGLPRSAWSHKWDKAFRAAMA